jgi:hypothetical protein
MIPGDQLTLERAGGPQHARDIRQVHALEHHLREELK